MFCEYLSLQPVHNNGSSGYGSLGSNGSHEHYISVASSSDSNGNLWEDSHREPVRQLIDIIDKETSLSTACSIKSYKFILGLHVADSATDLC